MFKFKSEAVNKVFGAFFNLKETLAARRQILTRDEEHLDSTLSKLSAFEFAFRALMAPAIVLTVLMSSVNIFLGPQNSYHMYVQEKNSSEYVGRQIALLEEMHAKNPSEIMAKEIDRLKDQIDETHPVVSVYAKLYKFKDKFNFIFVILVILLCSRFFSWSVRKKMTYKAEEIYLFALGASLMAPAFIYFVYVTSLDYAATYEWKSYLNTHFLIGVLIFIWFIVAISKSTRIISDYTVDFPKKRRYIIWRVLASVIGGGIAAQVIFSLVLIPFVAIAFAAI